MKRRIVGRHGEVSGRRGGCVMRDATSPFVLVVALVLVLDSPLPNSFNTLTFPPAGWRVQPSLRDGSLFRPSPGVETPGYFRMSLRDQSRERNGGGFNVPSLKFKVGNGSGTPAGVAEMTTDSAHPILPPLTPHASPLPRPSAPLFPPPLSDRTGSPVWKYNCPCPPPCIRCGRFATRSRSWQ